MSKIELQVLLVEDDPNDMSQFLRDLPSVFEALDIRPIFHQAKDFVLAAELIDDRSRRFDLILSDTYRGHIADRDAAVVKLIAKYRGGRFCPLIVFSASAMPEEVELGSFVLWADKAEPQGIEKAIRQMIATGVPQAARTLHDELDRVAGSYLWNFLDSHWVDLERSGHVKADVLSRMIRRRAALQLAEINFTEAGPKLIDEVHGLEFYVYPPIDGTQYSLGEIVRKKSDHKDIRLILTPHCYLTIQQGQQTPRAEFVKTVKTIPAKQILGETKISNAKAGTPEARHKKLSSWATPPSGQDVGKPEGRYWYLPAFLEIPHLYCDLMQVNSVAYSELRSDYESLAILSPPYAESLQACYGSFHGAVGIPKIRPGSIENLLDQ